MCSEFVNGATAPTTPSKLGDTAIFVSASSNIFGEMCAFVCDQLIDKVSSIFSALLTTHI